MRGLRFLIAAALLLLSSLPLSSPALAAETEHVVGEGETLNGIANRAGVTAKALADANGLKAPFALRTGQKLKIPVTAAAKAPTKAAAAAKPALAAKPKAPDNPALVKESVHLVKEGETLGGIANRAKVPRVLIAEANGLTPPYDVRPGQKLLIPRTRHYVVKSGDTGFDIAYRHAVPWSQIAVANGLDANAAVVPGKELLIPTVFDPQLPSQADKVAVKTAATANAVASAAVAAARAPAGRSAPRFAWPLEGTVRRGWKSTAAADHHDGLDIVAPTGTAVRAAAAGTVLFAGPEADQFGNLVVLDHGDGWNTAYGFLSRITVKKGAKVAAGERVGLIGNSGKARGTELHFEVRQDGKPVDPEPELPKAP
ncbi:murein DD-endopeptidase MepM/ murein hydrolase activator NlpD [Novosphingobium chloroacetimidivorans]|uniref:Murein DD-endopeptidase MepM/ murein hydrolase activator NlpD n=1 Tax=Novosphingobium chloroacetimidivorans TaxID=1428314 RepID=A0A7W7KCU3_9SPHN|nr:LysM peptidoglycan-binding domain-containing M23 family metallopeptidase [Novosphingobium chloroacetimidivorans]MBB4859914.1 murein DD-endopeptidase MepM/ murein hydrolase activator NlpD [Novosphingobium chloroacetimidivorans]